MAKIWGVQYKLLINGFCPTLADLKSQVKLPRRLRQRTINQLNWSRKNVSTNRITEILSEKAQNKWASDAKCQTATLVHTCWTSRHFDSRFILLIVVTEKGRTTSPVEELRSRVESANFAGSCTHEKCACWFSVIFVRFCSGKKQKSLLGCLHTSIYPREIDRITP